MREVLTEFDEYVNAMRHVNLNESVMPYVNGRLVNSDSYNKVQKLLDCPEMISSHKWLYNLDLDQLEEDETVKIDKLYKLGCDRGFIQDDLTHFDSDGNCIDDYQADMMKDFQTQKDSAGGQKYTVIYSAVGPDDQMKTGQAFSSAVDVDSAKYEIV